MDKQIKGLIGIRVVSVDEFITAESIPEDEFLFLSKISKVGEGLDIRVCVKFDGSVNNVFTNTEALNKRGLTLQEFVDKAKEELRLT